MNFIRKQTIGDCVAEACANLYEKLTGIVWSEDELHSLFLEAGGKDDTDARDGAITPEQFFKLMKSKGMIKGWERIFHNPAPYMPKNDEWIVERDRAKSKIIDATKSSKTGVLLAIYTPTGGLKLNKDGFPFVGDHAGMHAVCTSGIHLERGRMVMDVENSWGPRWGLQGFFKINIMDLDTHVRSAYIITK